MLGQCIRDCWDSMKAKSYFRGNPYEIDPESDLGKLHFRFVDFDKPLPHAPLPGKPVETIAEKAAKVADFTLIESLPPEAMGLNPTPMPMEDPKPIPVEETVEAGEPGAIPEI